MERDSPVTVPPIVKSIRPATVEVCAVSELMTPIKERPLNVAMAEPIYDYSRAVRPVNDDRPRTARTMDDRHVARVNFADRTVVSEARFGTVASAIYLRLAI